MAPKRRVNPANVVLLVCAPSPTLLLPVAKAKPSLCIVGMGYVGLPLAHAFARAGYRVHGFDVNPRRIEELSAGFDRTLELTEAELRSVKIAYSTDPKIIKESDIIIVAVPTPIDEKNNPDLTMLMSASTTVGQNLKKGAIVVYESTVWPGTTEEICGPIIAKESGLQSGRDFFLGYSPERINPGDKEHTVDKIIKVVAGQTEKTTDALCDLYGSIVSAGIHRAPSIKVAEMAKAIENAQRDLNIAFVNEIAMMSNALGIATNDVLEAAGTKWNFLRFRPGLVGGHCIGVDPYYLVEKAKQLGMTTHVITAGRSVNDGMSLYVAQQILKALSDMRGARVLILGLTFKENIPDVRNSKVRDVARALEAAGCDVLAHDPFYDAAATKALGYNPGTISDGPFDAIALLVPHEQYLALSVGEITGAMKPGGVLYDLKGALPKEWFTDALFKVLSL